MLAGVQAHAQLPSQLPSYSFIRHALAAAIRAPVSPLVAQATSAMAHAW